MYERTEPHNFNAAYTKIHQFNYHIKYMLKNKCSTFLYQTTLIYQQEHKTCFQKRTLSQTLKQIANINHKK